MPPSSPVLSSQPPPPPPPGWRLVCEPDYIDRFDGLKIGQAQTAELRALHAAMISSARSPWKAKNNPARRGSLSSSSTECRIREYPVFRPSHEDVVLGEPFQHSANRRNSIDQREGSQEGRSSCFLDDYTRSSSGLGSELLSSVFGPEESRTEESPPSIMAPADAIRKGASIALGENSFSFNMGSVPRHYATLTPDTSWSHLGSDSVESLPHRITSIHPIKASSRGEAKSQIKAADTTAPQLTIRKKPLGELLTEAIEASRSKPYIDSIAVSESGISCDKCRPGVVGNTVVPLTSSGDFSDTRPTKSRTSAELSHNKDRSTGFKAWFSRVKKKNPSFQAAARSTISKESVSGVSADAQKDLEVAMAIDLMELKVSQANRRRDTALAEVLELRLAMEDMGRKLDHVEDYCRGLKHALEGRNRREMGALWEGDEGVESAEEVSIKLRDPQGGGGVQLTKSEFFHAVTEARVAVKQLCRALLHQLQEGGKAMSEVLRESLKLSAAPRSSRSVRYHLEALINGAFYEDFENVSFERRGAAQGGVFEPRRRAAACYASYVAMRKLGCADLLSDGREEAELLYSQSFDGFCAVKMGAVEAAMAGGEGGGGAWSEEVVQAFFVAARSVWLLHRLAFAFSRSAAAIFRVAAYAAFDGRFMEELPTDHRSKAAAAAALATPPPPPPPSALKIRVMVMPGFFLLNDVLKCKVLCWHT